MSVSVQQIIDAQAHIGTLKSEAHPKTKKYWAGVINGIAVLNPEVVAQQLENAKKIIKEAKDAGKEVLVVCEKKMFADEIAKIADSFGVSYLNYKAPAGFLTNFDTFKKRIQSMNKMASFIETEEYKSLTKKEQLVYKRKLDRVQKIYKGAKNLQNKPELVVVVDGTSMDNFVNEIVASKADSIVIASSNFKKYWNEDRFVITNMQSYKSVNFVMNYLLSK